MRILIDIGHPAHVHYFRNVIRILKQKKHKILVTARDKEVSHQLLHKYKIDFITRGRGRKTLIGKLFYTIMADLKILNLSIKWKPDVFVSFGSPYASHVSKIIGKPHIALTDTEHANLGIIAFAPFTDTIITPDCFLKSFKAKHIRFKGYFELGYLAPKYFIPDEKIIEKFKEKSGQNVVLFRYVSWGASHDIGQSGIPDDMKMKLINLFIKKKYKILISAESMLNEKFEKYRIKISPDKIHHILGTIDIFIGESGTMATEAAILGTPSIYVNSLDAGVFQDEVRYGLLYSYRNVDNLVEKINNLLEIDNLKEQHIEKVKKLYRDKIDITEFLVWFIETYPESKLIMNKTPDYQYRFKQLN